MKNTFSLIVQGALDEIFDKVNAYLEQFDEIIISSWKYEWAEDKYLRRFRYYDPRRLKIILNEGSLIQDKYNPANVHYQAYSTYQGLLHSNSKFSVKMRTDEAYSDWSFFKEKLVKNPKKLVTNNVFFLKDEHCKFGISDHVVGGTTKTMKATYKNLLKLFEGLKPTDVINGATLGMPEIGDLSPEQMLCIAYLRSKWDKIAVAKSKELVLKHIELVSVSQMGSFCVKQNSAGRAYYDEFTLRRYPPHSISCLEEL
jgi:hypothetical protein